MANLKPHIAVIGAGKLGSRHLQGLTSMNREIDITVIEPDSGAMEVAKNRYNEMPVNPLVRSVRYFKSLDENEFDIDVCIVATNADVRRNVVETLLNRVEVNYLILEKVAFQSVQDFEYMIQFLHGKKTKAWVNCPRRMVPVFRDLREKTVIHHKERVKISVAGSLWGLASNTIHMLDLLAFITGRKKMTVDVSGLDNEVYMSKRPGFIELGGRLTAQTEGGDILEVVDDREATLPLLMHIETDEEIVDINQTENSCGITFRRARKEPIEMPFHIPVQSALTGKQTDQILEKGTSDLTSLEESFLFHKPMLDAFNAHLSSIRKRKISVCPIT
jgi:hypothetical protein